MAKNSNEQKGNNAGTSMSNEEKVKSDIWSATKLALLVIGIILIAFPTILLFSFFATRAVIVSLLVAGMITAGIVLVIILIAIANFAMRVYLVEAKKDMYGTFGEEGTFKIVFSGGKFKKALMFSRKRAFDKEWNIVDKGKAYKSIWRNFNIFGCYPILSPIETIFKVNERYSNASIFLRKGSLTEITIGEIIIPVIVEAAEDINKLDVGVDTDVKILIENPEIALFATTDFIESVVKSLRNEYISQVASDSFGNIVTNKESFGTKIMRKEIIVSENKQNGTTIKELVVDKIRREYGVRIKEISVKDITSKEQEAIKAKKVQELENEQKEEKMKGDIKRGSMQSRATAEQEAIKTFGLALHALLLLLPEKTTHKGEIVSSEVLVKRLFSEDPEEFERLFGQKWREALDIAIREMGLSRDAYFDMRTLNPGSGSGLESISAVAAIKILKEGSKKTDDKNEEPKEKQDNGNTSNQEKKDIGGKKKSKYDEKTIKAMKDAGIETGGIEKGYI